MSRTAEDTLPVGTSEVRTVEYTAEYTEEYTEEYIESRQWIRRQLVCLPQTSK